MKMENAPAVFLEEGLQSSEKIFNDDPYCKQIEAKVLWVQGPHIVTDKTIFYAESGGQESDSGTIGGIKVVTVGKQKGRRLVVEKEEVDVPVVTVDTVFIHTLCEDVPFKAGDVVSMEIDWARRYRLMQNHSAAHFLYFAAHQIYDTEEDSLFTKGCHITESGARLDFFGSLSGAEAPKVEKMANDFIQSNTAIIMDPEPLTKDIHYWRCGEIIIPCGGTHVRSTQELAPIKVKRTKKGKTTTRLSCVFADKG